MIETVFPYALGDEKKVEKLELFVIKAPTPAHYKEESPSVKK